MCYVPRSGCEHELRWRRPLKETIELNGQELTALLDSGSNQTLVHRDYVSPQIICNTETVPICCVHGDEKPYPTADVYVKVLGQTYLLNVGVPDTLESPVVLGNDLPVFFDLLGSIKTCNQVPTRARAKSSVQHGGEMDCTLRSLPFSDAKVETGPDKSRKSRRQGRQDIFLQTVVSPTGLLTP